MPRAVAGWNVHNLAVVYADYALCMAGPTGPVSLREDPGAYRELLRLRVVVSQPDARPFAACQKFMPALGLSEEVTRRHEVKARQLRQYRLQPFVDAKQSLDELVISLAPLKALRDRAGPFVRVSMAGLMKPSSHAREAAHPSRPPEPGWGTGLPDRRVRYRSTAAYGDIVVAALGSGANTQVVLSKDGGQNWAAGGRALASELTERCVADEQGRAFTISRLTDGRHIALSHGPGGAPQVAVLGESELKVAGISCDASSLVAVMVEEPDETGHRPVQLRNCPFRRPCERLAAPKGSKLYYPLDLAKAGGDVVVARSSGKITRVSSSRDGGRSWTPWVLAYDADSARLKTAAPHRLLVVGDVVLLYSGGSAGKPYVQLVSTNHGASFFAPSPQKNSSQRSLGSLSP